MTRRIALVCPYALGVFGGVQEQVLAMSRELTRRGDEVLVLAPDATDLDTYDTTATIRHYGRLRSVPANGSRAPITLSLRGARRARGDAAAFAPDVVHFHEPFAPLVGWGVLRAHAAPAVATFHRSGDGPAFTLTRPLLRRLASNVDASAAVSALAATTIEHAVALVPVVLFNGFEAERFVATPRERGAATILVTVGRLEQRKGTRVAIEVVRAHNRRGVDPWHLVVIGEGPERAALERAADADPCITFTGALDDVQKRRWLRRASAVIAPALHGESFGLVLLEAMASETPVVASDIPGYREAAGGHATLFAPSDAAGLERAVLSALADESPVRLDAARAHAQHWSMRALVDAYEALYERARDRFHTAR